MKKISLAILAGTLMFTSCKKGENDPSISLYSRKARVAGEWNVDKIVSTTTETGTNAGIAYTEVNTTTFDGTNFTNTSTNTSGSTSVTETVTGTIATNTMTFEKEGTFVQNQTYTTVETEDLGGGDKIVTTTTHTDVYEGTWNFLGKVDEFKNKERMVLNTTKQSKITKYDVVSILFGNTSTYSGTTTNTNTFADGENSQVWAIDRLAKKEMVVKGEIKNTDTNSTTTGSTTTTTTTNTSGSIEIELSQE